MAEFQNATLACNSALGGERFGYQRVGSGGRRCNQRPLSMSKELSPNPTLVCEGGTKEGVT